jgi:hypothetical protein
MDSTSTTHVLFDEQCTLHTVWYIDENRLCRCCEKLMISVNVVETPHFCFDLNICKETTQICAICAYILMDDLQYKIERSLNSLATRIQRWYLHHKYKPGGLGYKKALRHWDSCHGMK